MSSRFQQNSSGVPQEVNDTDDDNTRAVSKSQRKRDMHALQDLGGALVELPPERLRKIDMPDNLRDAIFDAQRMGLNEARRRQLQYIGKLMRNVDPQPIQQALDALAGISRAENARLHRLENLRERFIADETVLTELVSKFPSIDTQHLRQLRRNALKEKELSKPPRAYREIFKILRELEEGGADDEDRFSESQSEDDNDE